MKIFVVYRGNLAGPICKDVHHLDGNSVFDAFKTYWQSVSDLRESEEEVLERGEAIFGPGYNTCLYPLAFNIAASRWPVPRSCDELQGRLEELVSENELMAVSARQGQLSMLGTDDVYESALYIFDESYAVRHSDRVAFLLQPDWVLPVKTIRGSFEPLVDCRRVPRVGTGIGSTFIVFFRVEGRHSLTNLGCGGEEGCWRIDGVRLPELPRCLAEEANFEGDEFGPWEICSLTQGLAHYNAESSRGSHLTVDPRNDEEHENIVLKHSANWLEEDGTHQHLVALTELLRRCPPSRF